MAIAVGDRLPDANFQTMAESGSLTKSTQEVFGQKKIVLFAVPGAYTPTCHLKHLPGYIQNYDTFKDRGIDEVACISVNDVFVLDNWSMDTGAKGRILFLADGSCLFTRAIGLENDSTERGMGFRSKRYSMLIDDRIVKCLNIDEVRGDISQSSAERMLEMI